MTATSSYREQYDRVKRWYARFTTIDKGRVHDQPSDYYLDEIYAFFLNCYHLKDWIKNDGTLDAVPRNGVEAFINTNRQLRLCADICNSLKHLHLTTNRSGEKPSFGRKVFGVAIGPHPTTISLKYEITTTTTPVDAFNLATECIGAWDGFLKSHGLL